MAARQQPSHRRRRSFTVAIVVIGFVALGFPAAAGAHSTTLVNALDFRAIVDSVGRDRDGLSARIFDADRKIELTVPAKTTVVVLGYAREPFLRFAPIGVAVNERSLSAIANKVIRADSTHVYDSGAKPLWSVVTDAHHYAWHDHRLGPIPGRAYAEGNVGDWTIPILVDGRREVVAGRLLHLTGPPTWPWLVIGCITLAVAAALAVLRRRIAEVALYAGATIAGAAAVALSVSFEFVPGRSPSSGWENGAVCIALAAGALALFFRLPDSRHAVAGFVALLAALVGLSWAGVLVHGFVISWLPAALVRGATVLAISVGAIAAACAAMLLLGDRSLPKGGQRRRLQSPHMAIPRGRPR